MKFKVKHKDGYTVEVDLPENATDDEIKAAAEKKTSGGVMSPKERRDFIGGGTLQFGPYDTGIDTPQWLDEGLAGVGRRMTEIGTLGTHKPDPLADKLLDDSIPAMVGGAATDIGALAFGGSALKAGSAIPKIGGALNSIGTALTTTKKLAPGVAAATAYGAATEPNRAAGGIGAGIGQSIGFGLPKLAGKVVAPKVKSAAQSMIKKGGTPTPGEMFGGTVQRFEDAATSVPIVGDAIKSAKGRSLAKFSRDQVDDALSVIGKKLDDGVPAGRDAIAKADDIISKGYNETLEKMDVVVDQQFADELAKITEMAGDLPERELKAFQVMMRDKILKPFDNPNQMLLGRTFKEVDSGIREMYKKSQKESQSIYVNKLGDAQRSVHLALKNLGKRQHPELGAKLDALDVSYAKMGRIWEAAGKVGAHDGVFTPAHLLAATKKQTGKKAFAEGKGFNQKEIEAARDMLAQKIPDSGTVPRAIMNTAAMGGAAMIDPAIAGGALLGAAAYTKPGQKAVTNILGNRAPWAAGARQGLEYMAPYSGLLGRVGGVQLTQ